MTDRGGLGGAGSVYRQVASVLLVVWIMLALLCSVVLLSVASPVFGQGSGNRKAVTMVGAGDIALCGSRGDEKTAKLVSRIPGRVFTLGDNAQVNGTAAEFRDCYGPSWGRFKKRTSPAVGNHEYSTEAAAPYFSYFGGAAGPAGRGYYAYRNGTWLVVVLNSNCGYVGCGPASRQADWLRKTLAKNRARCTAAMFHHPLFTSGQGASTPEVRPLWNILYRRDADVVLNGHAHSYEWFRPQTPSGAFDPKRGIRQFVVGTGGAEPVNPFGAAPANSVVRNDRTRGVMRLTLGSKSYAWEFVPEKGKTFTDAGRGTCH